jgi:hypothetical protein
LELQIGRNIKA